MAKSSKSKKAFARILNSNLISAVMRRKTYLIISHPKSGRTWLNVVLGKYFSLLYGAPENIFFDKHYLNLKIPKVTFTHLNSLEIVKNKDIRELQNKNVIFLIRDPRDVVVSYYYQVTKRKKSSLFSGSINEFVRSEEYGISKIISYMNLLSNAERISNKFLLVTYENLYENFHWELERILNFMNLPCRDEYIETAVQHGKFSKMKEMEKKNTYKTSALSVKDPDDKNSYKVRSGKIGGYVNYFIKHDIDFMNKEISEKLSGKFSFYK